MQGGKKHRSFIPHTTIQDTLCIYKDTKTFCKYLASTLDKVASIQLFYTAKEYDVLSKDEAETFLILLTKSTNTSLTSTFKELKTYLQHLENVTLVRQSIDEMYHPFMPVIKNKTKDVLGFAINYNKGSTTYHTCQQTCDEYIDMMTLSNTQYSKLLNDVSTVIDKIHKKGYCINGISHHTIGYFKNVNTFKILDWQFLMPVTSKKQNGYVLYSHPLKSYLNGATTLLAKRNISLGSLLTKNKWVRNLSSYQFMNAYAEASLLYILAINKRKNLINYIPHFDGYSLSLMAIFIAEKNHLKVPHDKVGTWLSSFTPNVK